MKVRAVETEPVRVACLRHTGPFGPALGEFWRGVGNYHSRTPERSRAYQGRVRGNLDRLRAKP